MAEEQQQRRSRLRRTLVIVLAATFCVYAVFGWFFPLVRDAARRASGGNDLKEAGLITLSYTSDHEGALPPLDAEPGRLMFSRDAMFPEYCPLLSSITCEFDATAPASQYAMNDPENRIAQNVDDHSMFYLGYFLEDLEQGLAFVEAYKNQAAAGGDFTSNLDAPPGKGSFGTNQFVRLTVDASDIGELAGGRIDGLSSLDEPKASIPVMIERPEHYNKPGGFVAYLDGRVKWHDYPGEWPMTKRFIEALESLDRLGPDTNQ